MNLSDPVIAAALIGATATRLEEARLNEREEVEAGALRPEGDAAKQVCQAFVNWSVEKAGQVRMLVKYSL